jgi:hypothetical protein
LLLLAPVRVDKQILPADLHRKKRFWFDLIGMSFRTMFGRDLPNPTFPPLRLEMATETPEYASNRRYRRFDLHFPVTLTFDTGGVARKVDAVSKNVSIGGLLVKASHPVPPCTRVKLMMRARSPLSGRSVRLEGEGKVVRLEPIGRKDGFTIAVACTHLISETENQSSRLAAART